jgi:rod shape-determining protein MreB
MHRGMYIAGGGALIKGLAELLQEEIKIPIHVAPDPLTAVARGAGIVLEDIDGFKEVLIINEDELPPSK